MVISGPRKQKTTFGVRVAAFVTLFDWLVVRQQSCAPGICVQSAVTILHLGGGPISVEELKGIVMHIFSE